MTTFVEISLIIVVATLIAGVMRALKQPLIIGYIITGLLIGPYFFNLLKETHTLQTFSEFGIALLLFIVGLNLSPRVIKEVGKPSFVVGFAQIVVTVITGALLSIILGFSVLESLFIGIALSFSSTIIILKLLSDKKDLQKLYGKIAIGILIVQDLVAAGVLIFLNALSEDKQSADFLLFLVAKGLILVVGLYLVYKFILPRFTDFFAKSQEFLFMFALAWGVGIAALFYVLGFSVEVGALAAGVILSMFPYNHEISSKMRPLRDFFLVIFFILLGANLSFGDLSSYIFPALVLSIFVLIINPLVVMILMGILGYKKKIGFLVGLTNAQISEFSLLVITIAVREAILTSNILSLITIVGIVTITISSYLIIHSEQVYYVLSPYLKYFERKKLRKAKDKPDNYEVFLFGCNRIGYDFLNILDKMKTKFIVIDFDPNIISDLLKDNISCLYADADDAEMLEELDFRKAKLVISTIPDYDTNYLISQKVLKDNPEAIILARGQSIEEAYKLYEAGVLYVIMPHFLGGKFASGMIQQNQFDIQKYVKEKKTHIKQLDERVFMGHEHPNIPQS